jgi:AhpD family alkylhydroperoxidase
MSMEPFFDSTNPTDVLKENLKEHSDAPKPYIKLDNSYGGGIVSLLTLDRGMAKHLTGLGQEIMRREGRSLTVGEREMIFAFVSKLNDCQFCFRSHAQAAELLYGNGAERFLFQEEDWDLPMRLRSLLVVAVCVQGLDKRELPGAIQDAKNYDCTDEEIWDTILVASFACMCNRMVDSAGTTFKPGETEDGGKSLVKYGYRMGVRRFFSEVLPKMWHNFLAGK